MRPRREQTFNKKKTVNLAKFCLKNTHPDQDKTIYFLFYLVVTRPLHSLVYMVRG